MHGGLKAQGLHPFPLPVGARLDEENPHLSTCIKCDTFDGFPCPAVYLSKRIPIAGVAHP